MKMKKRFFTVRKSQLGFDETVSAISKAAQEHGWEVPSAYDLQKAGQKAGYEDMTKVKVITLYNPHDGYTLLPDDDNKLLSALMPLNVSVYETNDGQVYVAGMNLGRISKMFRGVARDGLKASADNRAQLLENIVDQAEADNLRRLTGLSAVVIGIGALVGAIVAIVSKLVSERDAEKPESYKGGLEGDEKTT